MAEKSGNSVTENWPKWQIALAVGAPVAIGLAGLWYYRQKPPREEVTPSETPNVGQIPSTSSDKTPQRVEEDKSQTQVIAYLSIQYPSIL